MCSMLHYATLFHATLCCAMLGGLCVVREIGEKMDGEKKAERTERMNIKDRQMTTKMDLRTFCVLMES